MARSMQAEIEKWIVRFREDRGQARRRYWRGVEDIGV